MREEHQMKRPKHSWHMDPHLYIAQMEMYADRLEAERKELLSTLTLTGSRMDGNAKWSTSHKSQAVLARMFRGKA